MSESNLEKLAERLEAFAAKLDELSPKIEDAERAAFNALSNAEYASDMAKRLSARMPGSPEWTAQLEARIDLLEPRLRVVEDRVRELWIHTFGSWREKDD